MAILTNSSTRFRHITEIPPTAVIRAILLMPFDATSVTTTIQHTARIPTTCVELSPARDQTCVLSAPKRNVENGTQTLAAVLTIQTT